MSAAATPPPLPCPRCGYNLHGAGAPRCPECGLAFDAADLAAGIARENRPLRLDRCDPWQPHQLLVAGVFDLLTAALRPRTILRRTALHGPRWSAPLLAALGLLAILLVHMACIALAAVVHAGVSPAAGLRHAWREWLLATLAVHGPAAIFAGVAWAFAARGAAGAARFRPGGLRLGAAGAIFYCFWAILLLSAGVVLLPQMGAVSWNAFSNAAAALVSWWLTRSALRRQNAGRRTLLGVLLLHAAALGIAQFAAQLEIAQPGLNPPLAAYFS